MQRTLSTHLPSPFPGSLTRVVQTIFEIQFFENKIQKEVKVSTGGQWKKMSKNEMAIVRKTGDR